MHTNVVCFTESGEGLSDKSNKPLNMEIVLSCGVKEWLSEIQLQKVAEEKSTEMRSSRQA